MRFMGVARRYNIPMTLDTLRMFRASFLYDTVMYRLYTGLDMDEEYQRYSDDVGARARKRLRKAWKKRLEHGPTKGDYLRFEETMRMFRQIGQRIQHTLDTPSRTFSHMLSKASFVGSLALKLLTLGVTIHVVAVSIITGMDLIYGEKISVADTVLKVVTSNWYQIIIALLLLLVIRKILMRFEDLDV
jgi:hypothetical protein